MKTTETAITKIEIKVAGETLRLTLEQAKELQKILNKTFPEVSVAQVIHRNVYHYDQVPQRPYRLDPDYSKFWCQAHNQVNGALSLSAR